MHLAAGIGLSSVACVVPIPAEVESGDGGVNHAPVIVSSDPPMPIENNASIDVRLHPTVTVDIKDNDLGDRLYIRVFRDYANNPVPVVGSLEQPADPGNDDPIRTGIQIDTANWCSGPVELDKNYVFDVLVSDRPFNRDFEQPLFKVTDGETSIRSWVGICRMMN